MLICVNSLDCRSHLLAKQGRKLGMALLLFQIDLVVELLVTHKDKDEKLKMEKSFRQKRGPTIRQLKLCRKKRHKME